MKPKKIAKENATFFIIAVGMSFGMEHFARAVLDSSFEMALFPTDKTGIPGYIKVDSSSIRGSGFWQEFTDKIRDNFLTSVSYEFSSATQIEGELAEQVVFERDGYIFSFHIRQYERDSEHNFEIIKQQALNDIPEDEKLGRVAYLTITHAEHK